MTDNLKIALLSGICIGMILMTIIVTLADPKPYVPLCTTEDEVDCMWDSRVQGNGQGTSFIIYNDTLFVEEGKL